MTAELFLPSSLPPVNKKEVLRYAGAKDTDGVLSSLLDTCISLAEAHTGYRVAYGAFPVSLTEGGLDLDFLCTSSRDLKKNLSGCECVLVFGATLGLAFDRLIAREGALSPARALLLDSLGDERIEALSDAFCAEMADVYKREGCVLCPRFSPGYGDLTLETQKEIFRVLDLPKKIGLSLSESLLMTPRKSVTAFVGIRRQK